MEKKGHLIVRLKRDRWPGWVRWFVSDRTTILSIYLINLRRSHILICPHWLAVNRQMESRLARIRQEIRAVEDVQSISRLYQIRHYSRLSDQMVMWRVSVWTPGVQRWMLPVRTAPARLPQLNSCTGAFCFWRTPSIELNPRRPRNESLINNLSPYSVSHVSLST